MSFEICREKVILSLYDKFKLCLSDDKDGMKLIDPLEKRVIGFHYGETHFAVSWIIFGVLNHRQEMIEIGIRLLRGFIHNAKEYQKEKEFHWDFNNIAICLLIEFLESNTDVSVGLDVEDLKSFILLQNDSQHGTINWMPMRAYTNFCKYKWTGNEEYLKKAKEYIANVDRAAYNDGYYEDFLPKGKSFNFQYHIYTTAMMDFLSRRFAEVKHPTKAVMCCRGMLDCEGDINYLGRGNNQIFAWGPALYVLFENKLTLELEKATNYFAQRIDTAIHNYNIILCDLPGEDRNWWWDYHYATVYFAHLSYWLTLSYVDNPRKMPEDNDVPTISDSGVRIFRDDNAFVCVFEGRKHYLAERGPVLANIGLSNVGTVFKGPLGPYGGQFGNKYANHLATLANYFGPIENKSKFGFTMLKDIFPKEINVSVRKNKVIVEYDLGRKYRDICFSAPIHCPKNQVEIKVTFDSVDMKLRWTGQYVGPYGATDRYESRSGNARIIHVEICRRT